MGLALLAVLAAAPAAAHAQATGELAEDDFGAPPVQRRISGRHRVHPAVAPRPVPAPGLRLGRPGQALPGAPTAPPVAKGRLEPAKAGPKAAPAIPAPTPAGAGAGSDDVEEIDAADVKVAPAHPGPDTWWGDAWPAWDRVIDAYTARTVRKRTFGTIISHRNYSGFVHEPLYRLVGFGGGSLKVGLGVRYGILKDLDVGVFRLGGTLERFNTWEFDARYNILSQAKFGVDVALRAGVTWFEQYKHKDAAGALVSLLIDRTLFNRLFVGGAVLFHSNSSGPKKATTDLNTSVALQAYGDFRITEGFSVAAELTKNIAGYALVNPVFTWGPRFITNRHTFSIVMSNTQYTDADGIVAGTDRIKFSSWILGFNITREL